MRIKSIKDEAAAKAATASTGSSYLVKAGLVAGGLVVGIVADRMFFKGKGEDEASRKAR